MTEQNSQPQGEPYGLAMALLSQASVLPACVVIHPDHVLWPSSSDSLSPRAFQLLEPASAILSALKAHNIHIALLVAAKAEQTLHDCLQEARLAEQLAAVVYCDDNDVQQPQQQQQQQQQQQHKQQPQASNWAEAANKLKAQVGVPWAQMLFFSADPSAVRQANGLQMASVTVPGADGLNIGCLKAGLDLYSAKLEDDRGY